MENPVLGAASQLDYLDFHYLGQSFEGQIEVEKLSRELAGINAALQIALAGMIRHKRTNLAVRDIVFYVEPFEKGSFRKRIKVVIKSVNKNTGIYLVGIGLCGLVLQTITVVKEKSSAEISKMSPALQTQIGDALKVELLRDPNFLKGIAAATYPLTVHDDKLVLSSSATSQLGIGLDEKIKMETLANTNVEETAHEKKEGLVGRISSVDLDATVNHFGFKINNKGATVNCTLLADMSQEKMKDLLGQWVHITGVSTYYGNRLVKIDILDIKMEPAPEQGKIQFGQ
ncbi:MAG: hypothetical protein WC866_01765 [Patescibacteria group bacterium]|jgi:hypothetical protein